MSTSTNFPNKNKYRDETYKPTYYNNRLKKLGNNRQKYPIICKECYQKKYDELKYTTSKFDFEIYKSKCMFFCRTQHNEKLNEDSFKMNFKFNDNKIEKAIQQIKRINKLNFLNRDNSICKYKFNEAYNSIISINDYKSCPDSNFSFCNSFLCESCHDYLNKKLCNHRKECGCRCQYYKEKNSNYCSMHKKKYIDIKPSLFSENMVKKINNGTVFHEKPLKDFSNINNINIVHYNNWFKYLPNEIIIKILIKLDLPDLKNIYKANFDIINESIYDIFKNVINMKYEFHKINYIKYNLSNKYMINTYIKLLINLYFKKSRYNYSNKNILITGSDYQPLDYNYEDDIEFNNYYNKNLTFNNFYEILKFQYNINNSYENRLKYMTNKNSNWLLYDNKKYEDIDDFEKNNYMESDRTLIDYSNQNPDQNYNSITKKPIEEVDNHISKNIDYILFKHLKYLVI